MRHRHSFHSSRRTSRLCSLDPTHCSRAPETERPSPPFGSPARAYVFPPPVFTEITRHARLPPPLPETQRAPSPGVRRRQDGSARHLHGILRRAFRHPWLRTVRRDGHLIPERAASSGVPRRDSHADNRRGSLRRGCLHEHDRESDEAHGTSEESVSGASLAGGGCEFCRVRARPQRGVSRSRRIVRSDDDGRERGRIGGFGVLVPAVRFVPAAAKFEGYAVRAADDRAALVGRGGVVDASQAERLDQVIRAASGVMLAVLSVTRDTPGGSGAAMAAREGKTTAQSASASASRREGATIDDAGLARSSAGEGVPTSTSTRDARDETRDGRRARVRGTREMCPGPTGRARDAIISDGRESREWRAGVSVSMTKLESWLVSAGCSSATSAAGGGRTKTHAANAGCHGN